MVDMLQTKETMTLRSNAFGSKPVISESLLKKVEGLVKEHIVEFANLKQNKELAKTDGSKRSRIRGSCVLSLMLRLVYGRVTAAQLQSVRLWQVLQ